MPEVVSRLAKAVVAALAAVALCCAAALAQAPEPKKSPFGIAVPSAGETRAAPPGSAEPPGAFDRAWSWVLAQQRRFRSQMNAAVASMKKEPFGTGFLVIVMASFLYGVVHAAGPGHGKAVIASYVLANRQTVRRGVALAFLSALIQALSAISIFAVLSLLLNARKQDFDAVEAWLATLSWGIIAILGAWLVWRQVRPLLDSANALAFADGGSGAANHVHRHDTHGHGHHHASPHDHDHGADCDCGHAHIPAARDLDGEWSWGKALSIAAPVGIRPCTGALGVLALTTLNGLFWVGAVATLAMSLGTAITISAIAATAAGSRDLAARMGAGDGLWASRVSTAAGIAGAVVLFAIGTTFFFASLHGSTPI